MFLLQQRLRRWRKYFQHYFRVVETAFYFCLTFFHQILVYVYTSYRSQSPILLSISSSSSTPTVIILKGVVQRVIQDLSIMLHSRVHKYKTIHVCALVCTCPLTVHYTLMGCTTSQVMVKTCTNLPFIVHDGMVLNHPLGVVHVSSSGNGSWFVWQLTALCNGNMNLIYSRQHLFCWTSHKCLHHTLLILFYMQFEQFCWLS